MNEPVPPQDINAERAVLGSMLLSPNAIDDCTDLVTSNDFYRPTHETIHAAILALAHAGQPADAITVADELTKRGELARIGGTAYLHELVQDVPTSSNAAYYADIVHERAVMRRLVAAGTHIAALANGEGDGDLDDLINRAQNEVAAVADHHLADDTPTPQVAVYDALDALESPPGQPTPWTYLTNTLAGFKTDALYLIGARPGIGKTVAGVDIALDAARRGNAACFYSLEMSRTELYHRMLAHVGSIPMDHIQHRRMTTNDWAAASKAAATLAETPLYVDDRAALSLAQIRASIKARQRTTNVGIVVVDYLQLIAPPPGTPRDDRRVQVDAISRGLKNLAKECNVPVIALTQLNRGPEARADKRPTLSDLREAGGQEQDADVVILLHRDLHGDQPNVLHMAVAKNRHGPQGHFELRFRGEHSRIEDAHWRASIPHDRSHP